MFAFFMWKVVNIFVIFDSVSTAYLLYDVKTHLRLRLDSDRDSISFDGCSFCEKRLNQTWAGLSKAKPLMSITFHLWRGSNTSKLIQKKIWKVLSPLFLLKTNLDASLNFYRYQFKILKFNEDYVPFHTSSLSTHISIPRNESNFPCDFFSSLIVHISLKF